MSEQPESDRRVSGASEYPLHGSPKTKSVHLAPSTEKMTETYGRMKRQVTSFRSQKTP